MSICVFMGYPLSTINLRLAFFISLGISISEMLERTKSDAIKERGNSIFGAISIPLSYTIKRFVPLVGFNSDSSTRHLMQLII